MMQTQKLLKILCLEVLWNLLLADLWLVETTSISGFSCQSSDNNDGYVVWVLRNHIIFVTLVTPLNWLQCLIDFDTGIPTNDIKVQKLVGCQWSSMSDNICFIINVKYCMWKTNRIFLSKRLKYSNHKLLNSILTMRSVVSDERLGGTGFESRNLKEIFS